MTSPEFQLTNEIDIADCKSNRGAKGSKYPFADMAIGQSFHVGATAERPSPQKTLAGACAAANKRHADSGIKFACRSVSDSDPLGPGVRVFAVSAE